MNLEARFKAELVVLCRARGAYARRHEDKYALGLLDLAIKFPKHPHLLAEAKLVHHQAFAPSLRQDVEAKRYMAAGGLCALIAFDPKTKRMYISEWTDVAKKESSFTGDGDWAEQLETWINGQNKDPR